MHLELTERADKSATTGGKRSNDFSRFFPISHASGGKIQFSR